ncbi:MAG: class I SAM-dependent rRNA methyltransferase [Rhodospirillales bacterium]|nr:class I SAM-dependent rRNA methyltransferase [Rhodospirillales bacterium]
MADPHPACPRVFLLPGHDRRIAAGHPWAFSNEIRMDAETKALPAGTIATLHRVDGRPYGIGTVNPHALIAVRLFSRKPEVRIDAAFLTNRLMAALALRERLFKEPYYRLAHAEADGLPGLVADRFGDTVVLQLNTAGMQALTAPLLDALDRVLAPAAVVLRNDSRARALEGLSQDVAVIKGSVEAPLHVREGPLTFPVDVVRGQKTGWFYDQRFNRAFLATLASGERMVDVFCHSGAFAIAAAAAGATEVLGIDSSTPALSLAEEGAGLNGVAERCRFQRGDAFEALAALSAGGERYGVVAADPPAFIKSKKDMKAGLRGYRKLARLAAGVVRPGGFLFLASCSHHATAAEFLEETRIGIAGAGRNGRIIHTAGAGPDHPVHPHLPESGYLKTLVFQLD